MIFLESNPNFEDPMNSKTLLLVISCMFNLQSLAQTKKTTKSIKTNQKKVKNSQSKYHKKQRQLQNSRKGRIQKGQSQMKDRPEDIDDDDATESSLSTIKLPFGLPSWEEPSFSPTMEPIFGYQTSSEIKGGDRIDSGDIELGLAVDIDNIPLWVIDVGVYLSLHGGAARGNHTDLTSPRDISPDNPFQPVSESRTNTRLYSGGDLEFYLDSFRVKVGVEEGSLTYDPIEKKGIEKEILFSMDRKAALGARLPGSFSLWQSYRDFRAYYDDFHRPIVKELDYYFHTKFDIDFWNFNFNLGIGVSEVRVWELIGTSRDLAGHGFSKTLRSTATWEFTENWTCETYLKYAYSADEGLAEAYNAIRLPTQELARPGVINGTPEDTLNFWFFTGMKELIENLTIGYSYSQIILRYGKSDARSEIVSGPILDYAYEF